MIRTENFYLLNQLKKKVYKEFEKEYPTSAEYEQKNDTGNSQDFLNKYFLYLSLVEYSESVETEISNRLMNLFHDSRIFRNCHTYTRIQTY